LNTTELIAKLQEIEKKHGPLHVWIETCFKPEDEPMDIDGNRIGSATAEIHKIEIAVEDVTKNVAVFMSGTIEIEEIPQED
jgi:hypothetical protein